MADTINFNVQRPVVNENNKKATAVNRNASSSYTKNAQTVNYPQTAPLRQDEVFIRSNLKKKNPQLGMSTLQVVGLAAGTLASVAIFASFMPSLLASRGKTKDLKDLIQNFSGPDLVKEKLISESGKLGTFDNDSSLNYISNVLKLPWDKPIAKKIDIKRAEEIWDKNIIGLDPIKDEIMTFLKVENYKFENGIPSNKRKLLCLVGPPGVAKTSIGQVVADAMEKPFSRITLGGQSKASAIKGTERVYKNSSPGQIIKAIQDSKSSSPVILLDEIDKLGRSTENGSPAAALLDVLEPKQCKNFTDEFLEFPYDLSNATFIVTANDKTQIPKEIIDRLTIIDIPAYANKNKVEICKSNVTKLKEYFKLNDKDVKITDQAIDEIVEHTDDAGARKTMDNLDRVFDRIIAKKVEEKNKHIVVDKMFVREALKSR